MDNLQSIFEQLFYMSKWLVFFRMGMSMFDPPRFKSYDSGFIVIEWIIIIFVGRAAFVYPFSFILNYRNRSNFVKSNRSDKCAENIQFSQGYGHLECKNSTLLDLNTQHMVVFAGLRRPISCVSWFFSPTIVTCLYGRFVLDSKIQHDLFMLIHHLMAYSVDDQQTRSKQHLDEFLQYSNCLCKNNITLTTFFKFMLHRLSSPISCWLLWDSCFDAGIEILDYLRILTWNISFIISLEAALPLSSSSHDDIDPLSGRSPLVRIVWCERKLEHLCVNNCK